MSAPKPHFLLFSAAQKSAQPADRESPPAGEAVETSANSSEHAEIGRWKFVLEDLSGRDRLEASDEEQSAGRDRLDLLAVVRGLEALDQPSRVTLVTPSRYVTRGLRYGLPHWRENQWRWERFGELAPINNSDLWRRVDCALRFHTVDCRNWRFDPFVESPSSADAALPDDAAQPDNDATAPAPADALAPVSPRKPQSAWPRLREAARRWFPARPAGPAAVPGRLIASAS